MVPNCGGTNIAHRNEINMRNCAYLCTKPSTVDRIWRLTKNNKNMTEAEKCRWKLIGLIASAIGTAIAGYFAGKG